MRDETEEERGDSVVLSISMSVNGQIIKTKASPLDSYRVIKYNNPPDDYVFQDHTFHLPVSLTRNVPTNTTLI